MIAFATAGAAMILACLAIVLVPMWRAGRTADDRRREANIEVYRQRCSEIDRELGAGRVTAANATAEKDELGARLLADIDAKTALVARTAARASRPWLATALVVTMVTAGTAGAYGWLGDWRAVANRGMPNVDQMLARLAAEVKAHPDQRGMRLMLARIQQDAGKYAAAAHNLRVINQAAAKPDPGLLIAEAQATIAADGGMSGRAGGLFAKALRLDPNNRAALWYLGLRAAENGRAQKALGYWRRLLKQKLPAKVRALVVSRYKALKGDTPKL